MAKQSLPRGWTETQISELAAHHDRQTQEELVAEIEAALTANGEHAMEFEGTVREGVVVVDCSEPLPEGAKVRIFIEQSALTKQPTLAERLLRHSGTVPGLPPDIAAEHDHYIHGTPKR
jgi:hypothetical protein